MGPVGKRLLARFGALVAGLVLVGPLPATADEIYRWYDRSGNVYYTQQPPPAGALRAPPAPAPLAPRLMPTPARRPEPLAAPVAPTPLATTAPTPAMRTSSDRTPPDSAAAETPRTSDDV